MSSGSKAAGIPILLGLRVSPEVGNQLANSAMALGGVASVLITYEAFYGHRALWASNTAAAVQLRMLKSDLGYLRLQKIDGIDSGDLDDYHQRFQQTQQGAAEAWTHAPASSQETAANTAPSSDESFAQNGQDRKLLFVNAPLDRRTTSPDRLSRPPSPFVVQAGTIIPAALITGIRSDLPGQITAQVTENVYDSPTGRARLIPQGARLIGVYDSRVAFGQSRVLLIWTRLIMPNGRSIVLEQQQGADAGGYSGLEDEVENHWGELFKAALLSTILGVGAELGSGADTGSNTDIIQALRLSAANSLNQTGQQVVHRNLNIQPTLAIRPGFPVRVIVNRDLVLEPYRG